MVIDINTIRETEEITLAKYGLLSLVCIVYPKMQFIAYEIRSNETTLYESCSLQNAISKFNKLV